MNSNHNRPSYGRPSERPSHKGPSVPSPGGGLYGPPGNKKKVVYGVLGGALAVFSLPCFFVFFNMIISSSDVVGDLVFAVFAVFFGVLSLISASFLDKAFTTDRHVQVSCEMNRDWERRVLEVARQHKGELSVAQLAVDTNLSIEESQKALDAMVRHDVAQVEFSAHGDMFYKFPTFMPKGSVRQNERSELDEFDRMLAESTGSSNVEFGFDEVEQSIQEEHHHHQKSDACIHECVRRTQSAR